jgi:GABA(A) receptor-associated protein
MEYRVQVSSLEARRSEATKLLAQHPNKVPTIVEPSKSKDNVYFMPSNKFIVRKDCSFQELSHIIRSKLKLRPEASLCIVVGAEMIPSPEQSIGQLYELKGEADGFLYISYSSQQSYG